ncbi:MAG: ECF-type sigma factor [Isosphaeraceae bacterium]
MRFATTRWSMVLAARGEEAADARRALGELCEAYWYPLYTFVRGQGYKEDQAADLVQGFFAHLLEKEALAGVDSARGRFRSFLMACCSHYLRNQDDRDRAAKRGGRLSFVSIDRAEAEGRYRLEPSHAMTAEHLFERRWAMTVLERALERLEFEMVRSGRGRLYRAIRPILLGGEGRTSYAEIAAELGLSEEAARAAAHRLRKMYREILRDEVGRTVAGDAEIGDEIRDLFAALGGD